LPGGVLEDESSPHHITEKKDGMVTNSVTLLFIICCFCNELYIKSSVDIAWDKLVRIFFADAEEVLLYGEDGAEERLMLLE
jgi:hypothetical protein